METSLAEPGPNAVESDPDVDNPKIGRSQTKLGPLQPGLGRKSPVCVTSPARCWRNLPHPHLQFGRTQLELGAEFGLILVEANTMLEETKCS